MGNKEIIIQSEAIVITSTQNCICVSFNEVAQTYLIEFESISPDNDSEGPSSRSRSLLDRMATLAINDETSEK